MFAGSVDMYNDRRKLRQESTSIPDTMDTVPREVHWQVPPEQLEVLRELVLGQPSVVFESCAEAGVSGLRRKRYCRSVGTR